VANLLVLLALAAALFQAKARGSLAFRPGRDLVLAAVTFSGAALLSEVVAGEFSQRTWVALGSALAIGLSLAPPAWLITQLKRIAGIWVIGSAVTAVIAPEYTVGSTDSLIGIGVRVHGLANHPNGLAPIMLLYLMLEKAQPSRPLIRWTVGSTAFGLLVLAQSKTSWAAALAVAAIFWAARSRRGVAARLLVLALVGITFVGAVVFSDAAEDLEIVEQRQVDSLRTLTGRTALWQYGLESWRESPMFGAGPNLYTDFADRTGQSWAGQAHNQYVQTLGRHGLVGLAGLLIYVVVLLRYGLRHARATGYVSLALVSLLLLRTMTEANFEGMAFEEFAVLALLVSWERARHPLTQSGPARAPVTQPLEART
jgi:exopolysaccharide production protein ExoQ